MAIAWTLAIGLFVGLVNGVLVTILRVPAFIATLTMLFIGRGIVTGVSGGKTISFLAKAKEYPEFFFIGENNAWGFNNQVFIFAVFAVVGMVLLAKTTAGYQTFATGGNELASSYAGIPTAWVRMRAYLHVRLLRDGRRHDAGCPGSRLNRPVRPGPRIDRDRGRHRRRRVDTGRPRPCARQHARRHPHRAGRQGFARGLSDDAHRAGRQYRDEGAGGGPAAARRGAGLSRA